MDSATRTRLVNLLARTTSEHDGEALAAARKANQLLGRHGLTWSKVIPGGIPDPAAQPRPPAEDPMRPARPAGPDNHMSRGASAGNAARNPKSRYRPSGLVMPLRLPRARRYARVCLWFGLGFGLLLGANDGLDPPDFDVAGIAFALPALLGIILWLVLGGWLPRGRITR
jgi:hypothetical protein